MKKTIIEKVVFSLVAACLVTATVFYFWDRNDTMSVSVDAPKYLDDISKSEFVAYMPGIDRPEFTAVEDADLTDADNILVLSMKDTTYGFPLRFLSGIGEHVVNCSIDGTAISVAHCNEADVTRVFQGPNDVERIAMSQAGLFENELRVVLSGKEYQISDEAIPLESREFHEMGWEDFKEQYPDARVYKWPEWE